MANSTSFDAEAIVVGGGPAGSTIAALLADRGHRVILLDKASFPRHKACSEYINPEAVHLLRDLGVERDVLARGAHQMTAMRVHSPRGQRYLADFDAVEPGRRAYGLSRYQLDHLLLQRAEAAGVTVRQRAHVRDVLRDGGRVRGVEATIAGVREILRAPLVIGADGRHSAVVRALGLATAPRWPRQTGLVAHYRGVGDLGMFGEMHVARHGYAGLAPLEAGLTNVALVTPTSAVAGRSTTLDRYFDDGLAAIPAVAERLRGAERVGGLRGMGPMAHRARRVCGDGFLLVGDAASFLDPFTGEGIFEALRAATLASPVAGVALRAGDTSAAALAPYRAARRRAFTTKRAVCWIVQGFIHSPPMMDYVTDRLDRRPELGRSLAGVLADIEPARHALSPRYLARLLRP